MFTTLRTRLLLGIAPLLAIVVGLGLWAIVMFAQLGGKIDVILRENYRSVIAAQGMKEALERMDSAFLFAIGGREERGVEQYRKARPEFERALRVERGNVTLVAEGEQELADRLAGEFERYAALAERSFALPAGDRSARAELYFAEQLPLFDAIRKTADRVLEINQRNMEQVDRKAREAASGSTRLMAVLLVLAAVVATGVALALSWSILVPIRSLTRATRALARGDLDQVVPPTTRDELGELALAFNAMARSLREYREAGTARLLRAQKTAQATIDSFPDPVVVVDPSGGVERANPAARRLLGVVPSDGAAPWVPPQALRPALEDVLGGRVAGPPAGSEGSLCFRDDGQEKFFRPHVLPIRDEHDGLLGAAVVLTDVTRFRRIDQLKSDMVSTVSHELKTPLTGMQMAVHLLLEEAVGPLTPKQAELLMAARQDSDRLLTMIDDLLDLTRIEGGGVRLDLRPVGPDALAAGALQRFEAAARDKGVTLESAAPADLPPVMVDPERVGHVFDNLIGNALAHTPQRGTVRVSAEPDGGAVRFAVEDTGVGIPAEYRGRVFEKFFRVPGSRSRGGAGLGLAIAREIVAAHGGRIELGERPGGGARFTFTLPTDLPAHRQEAAP